VYSGGALWFDVLKPSEVMALIMDDHDKHEDLQELSFIKTTWGKHLNQLDSEAMRGIEHLKEIGELEEKEIADEEEYLKIIDSKISLDFGKFNEEKIDE